MTLHCSRALLEMKALKAWSMIFIWASLCGWSWDKKRKRVFDVAFCCRCPTILSILRRHNFDTGCFVWDIWRRLTVGSLWFGHHDSDSTLGRCQFVGICQISTSVPGWWQISYLLHISRGLVLWIPTQWDAAGKDRIGESSSLPNNSIPPAGPSWLPSYLWQPTKLVRVISGYPEWRLSPARGRSTSGETWLGAEVGTHRGFLTFLQSACSHDFPQIVSKNWCQIHWSHLNNFLCGKRKVKSGEKLECRGVGGGSGEGAGGSW